MRNVPVIFSITAVTGNQETLDRGGVPQFTDSNGQVFDTLRTRAPVGGLARVVEVVATPAAGTPGSVDVAIN